MAHPFRHGLADSQAPEEVGSEREMQFQAVLGDLGLTELYPQRITLNSVLKITQTVLSDNTPTSLKEIHKHFLYNVIGANIDARNTKWDSGENKVKAERYPKKKKGFLLGRKNKQVVESISILDLITAVFLCSDSLLQQTLMVKMSLCHFALPLLLPDVNQDSITFLLWAMRPVVHTWRPHSKGASRGSKEQSMVTTPMPMISFMRIGECRLSKSEVINSVISNDQHQFFVHRNMECGNFPRRLCNGLVEVCFHLPCGTPRVDVFSDIFSALNLRGDVRESSVQFQFLKANSDAVFLFVDKIGEKECNFLTSSFDPKSKLFLVMNPDEQHLEETEHFLNIVASKLNLNEENILHSEGQSNDVFFTYIKSSMNKVLNTDSRTFKALETLLEIALNAGIKIDEYNDDCQQCKELADCIIREIKTRDVESFKATALPAQGELWQKWSTKDKEQNRLKLRGDRDKQEYIDHLDKEKRDIRNQQSDIVLSDIVDIFVSTCLKLPEKNKVIFLQWMKLKLDARSTEILIPLQETCNQLCSDPNHDKDEFIKLNTKMTNSSLGLEHFMREAGQIYEASKASAMPAHPQFRKLPSVMAQLLINGFPMELLDGDAGCIPIDWVMDVLTQVQTQLGGKPRVFVLSVLGVQSSGKSTLLNVMFGLQFAVGSSRCTRGAFMQLLRIDDELQRRLGFDFLLVIDTEGLKAPQLASLDDSYEHDNELATVVIGLSDVVIVNLVSDSAEEMKDILQVVVHALLRMTETGKKPSCLFIHQRCGDVTAVDKNRNAHRLLLNKLDEMTKAAAKMEHKAMYYTKFTDVIAHDMNMDSFFIPGLRSGSSEMAPVSRGYSKQVLKIKTHIVEILEKRQSENPCTLSEFSKWISTIWLSVKRETYIFSFRNILVIEAYNRLCSVYTGLERQFCSKLISWTLDAQNTIMNTPQKQLRDADEKLTRELSQEVQKRKAVLIHDLNDYFSIPSADTNLTVKYKAEFEIGAAHLVKNTQKEMLDKCKETVSRRECSFALETMKNEYTETISRHVKELLQKCKTSATRLNKEQLITTFEEMWRKTVSMLPRNEIENRNVREDMEKKLRHNTLQHEALVNEKLQDSSIFSAETPAFQVKPGYVTEIPDPLTSKRSRLALIALSQDITEACSDFIQSKTSSNSEYFPHVWDQLLDITDSRLQKASEESIQFSKLFVIDLKLHICAIAIGPFTKTHERFITENNPWNQLPSMKESYCRMFTEMYTSGDEKNTSVIIFSHQSLKPALLQLIDQRLGHSILDYINSKCGTFSSRKHLQLSLLSDLIEKNECDIYYKLLNNYSQFTTEWIQKYIINYCKADTENIVSLLKCILDNITQKVKKALDYLSKQSMLKTVGDVFERLKQSLEKDIVLPMGCIGIVSSSVLQDSQSVKEFCEAVGEEIDRVSNEITTEFEKSMDVESLLDRLAVKPHEALFKSLVGCGKACPLCKAPCDRGGGDHGEHATTLHYPQGLCGHTWSEPGKLSTEVCTASVSKRFFFFFKIHKFVNVDTHHRRVRYVDYRTVNDYYASWYIPEDPKLEPPLFWKFVFCNFNEKFAKIVEADPADIPNEWKSITKQEVKDDLRRQYGVPQTNA